MTKKILLLLPILIFLVLFELLGRAIPTSYGFKHDALTSSGERIEVLVTGSSHSNFGIDPQYFGRPGFNIANTSQCLAQDYQLLSKYLPQCRNVKMVVVPISYFTLQTDLALSPEAWRCAYYSVYMGVLADPSSSPWELRNQSALALWDGPIGVVKNLKKTKKLSINAYGYQAPDVKKPGDTELINDRAGRERVEYHNQIMNPAVIPSNLAVLEQMAGFLKRKNIEMVLVVTPVYKTYSQYVSPKSYDIMVQGIAEVAKKHNLRSYNYFFDERFEIEDFMDNDHLNEAGASKFSKILKQEVVDSL